MGLFGKSKEEQRAEKIPQVNARLTKLKDEVVIQFGDMTIYKELKTRPWTLPEIKFELKRLQRAQNRIRGILHEGYQRITGFWGDSTALKNFPEIEEYPAVVTLFRLEEQLQQWIEFLELKQEELESMLPPHFDDQFPDILSPGQEFENSYGDLPDFRGPPKKPER